MTAAETLDPYRDEIEHLINTQRVSAGDLAKRYKVTRGAVIGWASRRGVQLHMNNRRVSNSTAQERRKKLTQQVLSTAVVQPKKTVFPVVPLPAQVIEFPEPLRIPFAEARRDQCQRPLWGLDARTGDVCGLPVKPCSSYCEGCHRVFWMPVPKPVRKAKPGHSYYNPVTNHTHWRP